MKNDAVEFSQVYNQFEWSQRAEGLLRNHKLSKARNMRLTNMKSYEYDLLLYSWKKEKTNSNGKIASEYLCQTVSLQGKMSKRFWVIWIDYLATAPIKLQVHYSYWLKTTWTATNESESVLNTIFAHRITIKKNCWKSSWQIEREKKSVNKLSYIRYYYYQNERKN